MGAGRGVLNLEKGKEGGFNLNVAGDKVAESSERTLMRERERETQWR